MKDAANGFMPGINVEKVQEMNIRLFGAFRDLEKAGVLKLNLELPATVSDLKRKISIVLARYPTTEIDFHSLLQTSALASASSILTDQDIVTTHEDLALLPPVCGG